MTGRNGSMRAGTEVCSPLIHPECSLLPVLNCIPLSPRCHLLLGLSLHYGGYLLKLLAKISSSFPKLLVIGYLIKPGRKVTNAELCTKSGVVTVTKLIMISQKLGTGLKMECGRIWSDLSLVCLDFLIPSF